MSAVADVQTVNITINDIEIAVPKGELIVESVKRLGLEIPIFCYHPRMKPVGMCRMCLVEIGTKQPDGSVRKMPKPQAACTLPASEGLVVFTDTEMVHTDRRGVLEFLLINHPLDCPICDRGGECPLQNNTLFYGPSTSRYIEVKRHLPKAYHLSDYVTLDLERCIQCGRCVRFTEEISGDSQLAFRFRGASMQPSTFELRDFTSKFSGNVIEICPVGALTNGKYRFRARPWDLQTRPGLCTNCSNGCNVWLDYRNGKIMRVNGRTNEDVNEEWTCDRGKFGHEWIGGDDRLETPHVRSNDTLAATDWAGAYSEILRHTSKVSGGEIAGLAGSSLSNEDYYVLRQLFRETFASANLDHRFQRVLPTAAERVDNKLQRKRNPSKLSDFQDKKAILLFGTSLADEEPILFLRVRKAWFQNGAKVIVAHHEWTDADGFAHLVLRYREGTADALAAGLAAAAGVKGADARFTPEHVESLTGVRAADIVEAASILKTDAPSVVTTRSIYDTATAITTVDLLASLALGVGGTFDLFALQANEEGAERIGVLPDGAAGQVAGLNTHEILKACADGQIKVLWLAGVDPLDAYPDKELALRALENVEFLIFHGTRKSEAFHYASVALPMTAPSEAEGSYTNLEGRIQWFGHALDPRGEAKPAWRTFQEVGLRVKPTTPYFTAKEISGLLAAEGID